MVVVEAGLPFVCILRVVGAGGAAGSGQLHVDERIGFALAAVWVLMSVVRAGQLSRARFEAAGDCSVELCRLPWSLKRLRRCWVGWRLQCDMVGFQPLRLLGNRHSWLRPRLVWKLALGPEDAAALNARAQDKGNYGNSGFARMTSVFQSTTFLGRRAAALCVSDEVDRPSVVGFFAPRILVPAALLERLSADELRQIVLHEMEHLRRGDDWTNLLQKLSLVVFPLNPALIWIERQLCVERELASRRSRDAGYRCAEGFNLLLVWRIWRSIRWFGAGFLWRWGPGSGSRRWCGGCTGFWLDHGMRWGRGGLSVWSRC